MVSAKQKANWARFAKMARANARRKGKSKKGRRLRSMSRKGKSDKPKKDMAVPAGAVAGGILNVVDMATTTNNVYGKSAASYVKEKKYAAAGRVLLSSAERPRNYKFAAVGLGVSVAPKVPVIRKLAGPADRVIRRIFHKKVSM